MDKPPEEIYRCAVDDIVIHQNDKPQNPLVLYNKYIREDIVEKIRLSAYAYARAMANLNKGKK